jgi:hypothetical protein
VLLHVSTTRDVIDHVERSHFSGNEREIILFSCLHMGTPVHWK